MLTHRSDEDISYFRINKWRMEEAENRLVTLPRKSGMISLVRSSAKMFVGFTVISGLGWLCDLLTFTLLIEIAHLPGNIANFVSSYVGVTLVWFMALSRVFRSRTRANHRFLLIYWGYQFVSILAYSVLLHAVAAMLSASLGAFAIPLSPPIAAKVIITPCNLVTNFLFMKLLTRHMREDKINHA